MTVDFLGVTVCISIIFFYFFVGRVFASHSIFERKFATSGLFNIFTAIGFWFLFSFIFIGLNVKLDIAWWFFIGFAFLAYLYFLSSRHPKLNSEHSIVMPLIILIFLVPSLYFLSADVPKDINEFVDNLRYANYLSQNLSIPNLETMQQLDFKTSINSIGSSLVLLPSFILSSNFSESYFAIFNLILLVFVSDSLIKLTDIEVKWSNLGLASVVSIIAVTALNPFFSVAEISISNSGFLFSAAILAAIFPLCREKNLPSGIASLPIALVLSSLIFLHSTGVYAVSIIICLWFFRKLFEKDKFINIFFSATVIISLPTIAYHLNLIQAQNISLINDNNLTYTYFSNFHLNPVVILILSLNLILLLIELVSLRSLFDFKTMLTKNSWLVMPVIFTFAYMFISMKHNGFYDIKYLQFVAIIPLWHFISSWYKNSKWQRLAYNSPWLIALSFAVIFYSLQFMVSDKLTQRYNAAEFHTLNVADNLKENILKANDNIAVLEWEGSRYSNILRYRLNSHQGKVINVNDILETSVNNIKLFHNNLKNKGINYLWIHSPSEKDQKWLGRFLKTDRSYLFKITDKKFKLLKIYKHPSFTYKNL